MEPMEASYADILKVLVQHFNLEPSKICKTYRFQTRVQGPSEKVADYLAELGKITDNYNFGAALEHNLRNLFFIGLRDKAAKMVLLAKPKTLNLDEALGIARAAEVVTENVTQLSKTTGQAQLPAREVNALQATGRRPFQKAAQQNAQNSARLCICCGDGKHTPPNCPHRSTTCFKYKKQGHLASACLAHQCKPGQHHQFLTKHLVNGEDDFVEPSDSLQHLYSVSTVLRASQMGSNHQAFQMGAGDPEHGLGHWLTCLCYIERRLQQTCFFVASTQCDGHQFVLLPRKAAGCGSPAPTS